uniref:Uncharacterized protein n=1 Tax=Leptocylindrus danicus TaxID=163516 RepID=A0A7S2L014_9STRA
MPRKKKNINYYDDVSVTRRRRRSKSKDRGPPTPRSERRRNYSGAASVKSSSSRRLPKNEGYVSSSSRQQQYASGGSVASRRRKVGSKKIYSGERSVKSLARSTARSVHEYDGSYPRMRRREMPQTRDRRVSVVLPVGHDSQSDKRNTFYDDRSIGQTTISSHGLTWAPKSKQTGPAITQSSTPSTDPISFAEEYASEPPPGVLARVSRILACGAGGGPCGPRDEATTDPVAVKVEQPRQFLRMVDDFDNIFEGQYNAEGLRDGYGTMYYASTKDKYEGEWLSGKPHGLGKLCRGDGTGEFEGLWSHGSLHGIKQGIASVVDRRGNRYDGEFLDWKKHGTGTLIKPDGEKYIGNWLADTRHGFGTLVFPDGSRFVGMFYHDKKTDDGYSISASFDGSRDEDDSYSRDMDQISRRSPMVLGLYQMTDHPMHPQILEASDDRSGDRDEETVSDHENIAPSTVSRQKSQKSRSIAITRQPSSGDDSSDNVNIGILSKVFASSNLLSGAEKKAAKRLLAEKRKLVLEKKRHEEDMKRTVEVLAKEEEKKKRELTKREIEQTRALNEAREQHEREIVELEKQRQKDMKAKMKEIELLEEEVMKQAQKEKILHQRKVEEEKLALEKKEKAAARQIENQARELDLAQRKLESKERKLREKEVRLGKPKSRRFNIFKPSRMKTSTTLEKLFEEVDQSTKSQGTSRKSHSSSRRSSPHLSSRKKTYH